MRTLFLLALVFCLSSCQAKPEPTPPIATPPPISEAPAEKGESIPRLAPLLSSQDQDGQPVEFEKLYKQGIVMVYFYPKADTPGCTAQACSLRDAYEELTDKGVTVIGVSLDNAESQRAFKEKHHLPFTLIPDTDKKVVEAFGVSHPADFANREAFLIREGSIEWHDNSASTQEQAADILKILKEWDDEKS